MQKMDKKKSGRIKPPCHHLCILEFQYRSPIQNHRHMRPSPSSAAGTSIRCTSTSTLRYSGPQSARGEGGGGAAVGRNRIVNRTLITRSFARPVYL